MFITIDLPPEVETQLREYSRERDMESMRGLLADAVMPTVEAMLEAPSDLPARFPNGLTEDEYDRLLEEMDGLEESGVNLPDAALSRESLYEDYHSL